MKRVLFITLMALSITSMARSPLLPQVSSLKIDLSDLLFVGLFGEAALSTIARMHRDRRLLHAMAMCVLLCVVLAMGCVVAYLNGTPFLEFTDRLEPSIAGILRHWIYIPGIFLVTMSRRLTFCNVASEARWLILLGTVSAGIDVLDLSLLWTGLRSEPLVVSPEYVKPLSDGGFIIRAPDQPLLLVAATVSLALMGRTLLPRRYQYISLVLLFSAIAMTQAKYMIVAMAVAFLADLILLRGVKVRLSKVVAVGLAAGVAAAVLGAIGAFHGFGQQFRELFIAQSYASDPSVVWRLAELRYAFQAFAQSPLVGLGLGSRYRPVYAPESVGAFSQTADLSYYVHNFYAWLLVDLGLIGLIAFLWFLSQPFRYIPEVIKQGGDAALYRATVVALLAYLVALSVAPVDHYGAAFVVGYLVALAMRAGELSRSRAFNTENYVAVSGTRGMSG